MNLVVSENAGWAELTQHPPLEMTSERTDSHGSSMRALDGGLAVHKDSDSIALVRCDLSVQKMPA